MTIKNKYKYTNFAILLLSIFFSVAKASEWQPLFSIQNDPKEHEIILVNKHGVKDYDLNEMFVIDKKGLHILYDVEADAAPFALILTKKNYTTFDMELEFKWGERKFKPRHEMKRDSGLLFHIHDVHETAQGMGWPRCLEAQIQEADVGDLWIIGSIATPIRQDGERVEFEDPFKRGNSLKNYMNVETPGWNKLRIEIRENGGKFYHNGKLVNQYEKPRLQKKPSEPLVSGKIGIQAEGAEVSFRNIRIREVNERVSNVD